MRSRILYAFLAVIISVGAQAQLLWKVSGNDLKKDSYLFGTHHLISKDRIPQVDVVLELCREADVMVGEMDLKEPGMQKKMLKGSVMTGKTMKDLVSATDYDLLNAEFKEVMGVGMNILGTFKPMMLLSMHQIILYIKSTDLKKQPEPIDDILQKLARANKKKVVGLESLDQQMNLLFNSIPLERQAEILLYEVRHKGQILSEMMQLNETYLSGDLKKLNELDITDESMKPEERRLLVDDRNLNWMKQLPALLNDQSCFVAVGCMHLIGETGLINQLRSMGYTVEPVRFQQ